MVRANTGSNVAIVNGRRAKISTTRVTTPAPPTIHMSFGPRS